MQVPQWVHMANPAYQGVLTHLNSDEQLYQARVEEALTGRPEQAAEAIVGEARLHGAQPALLEEWTGRIFAFTGLRAATIFQIGDSVIPPVLFLVLWWFLRKSGFSRKEALAGAALFCLLELYNLNRPLYQRTSFLVTLLPLLGIMAGVRGRRIWGVLGGAGLGILVGGYFWAWTFGWLWWGILLVWALIEAALSDAKSRKHQRGDVTRIVLFGIVGAVAALPAVHGLQRIAHDPLYADAALRSGIHLSHLPESWAYSGLFALMVIGLLVSLAQAYPVLKPYRYAVITVFAGAVALNQQLVHGHVLVFASHYLFALVLAAVMALLLAVHLRFRPKWLGLAAIGAAVYLAAIGYDGRYVLSQFQAKPADFSEQHFATLLPVLDSLPRGRILSDPASSLFIAANTKQDVVYTVYVLNELMSHEEMARRYCTSLLPLPPEDRHLETQPQLLWPEADRATRDPALRAREVQIVTDACADIDKNPADALREFGVSYVLWDKARQPAWHLGRMGTPLTSVATGSGWELFSLGHPGA